MYLAQVSGDIDHGASVLAPEVRLATAELGAFVIAVSHNRAGGHRFVVGGDGAIRIYPAAVLEDGDPVRCAAQLAIGAHPLSLAADGGPHHVILGCDDGTLRRYAPEGREEILARSTGGWVENVASSPGTGHRAYSVGRTVHVIDSDGAALAYFAGLPSTPSGIAFSPDGAMIAVARYNGVNIWDLGSGQLAHDLTWRGSHTAISWSPDGRFVVTATQDRDLHCWELPGERDFKMSGYPSKIRSIGWTASSAYICASGAETVTSWHCGDGGPGGKPALELGFVFNGTVMRVAPHPAEDRVAAGYDDGTVLIGDIAGGDALIAKPPGGGPVSAIEWAPDGRSLAAGTQGGTLAIIQLVA